MLVNLIKTNPRILDRFLFLFLHMAGFLERGFVDGWFYVGLKLVYMTWVKFQKLHGARVRATVI